MPAMWANLLLRAAGETLDEDRGGERQAGGDLGEPDGAVADRIDRHAPRERLEAERGGGDGLIVIKP